MNSQPFGPDVPIYRYFCDVIYPEVPIYRYEINDFRSKYCVINQGKKHNRTQIINKIMTS